LKVLETVTRTWMIAACVLIVTAGAHAAEPAKLAIVTTGGSSQQATQLQEIMTASLTGQPGLLLVEREAIARVLNEQALNKAGLVDPQTLPKIAELLGADLFLVIEVDPVSGSAIGLVGFEARTGVRLVDLTLAANKASEKDAVISIVKTMLAKYQQGPAGWCFVAALPPRNADLPTDMDGSLQSISQLVQRKMLSLPNVVVLERQRLAHVLAEHSLPIRDADVQKNGSLLAAGVTLQLEASRGDNEQWRVAALISNLEGKVLKQPAATIDPKNATAGIDAIMKRLAHDVFDQQAIHTVAVDRQAEAHRFAIEAETLRRQSRWADSVTASQAANALRPGTPAYQYGLMINQVMLAKSLIDPEHIDRYDERPIERTFSDNILNRLEYLTIDALKHADVLLAPFPKYFRKPTLENPNLITKSLLSMHLHGLIGYWRHINPANAEQHAAIEGVRERYSQLSRLHINISRNPNTSGELFWSIKHIHTQIWLSPLYCQDSKELSKQLHELLEGWIDLLEDDRLSEDGYKSSTPLASRFRLPFKQLPISFAADNGTGFTYRIRDIHGMDSSDTAQAIYPSLVRMCEHPQPFVRYFGRMMRLWAAQKLERIDQATALQQLNQLITDIAPHVSSTDRYTQLVLQTIISNGIRLFGGQLRNHPAEAVRDRPALLPAVELAAQKLTLHGNGYYLSGWLRTLIERGDQQQRQWAFAQIDPAIQRLGKKNRTAHLVTLRSEVISKYPDLAPPTRPWSSELKLFDAKAYCTSQNKTAYGQIMSADVVEDLVLVLVYWYWYTSSGSSKSAHVDLLKVPLNGGEPERLSRLTFPISAINAGGRSFSNMGRVRFTKNYTVMKWPRTDSEVWVIPRDGTKPFSIDDTTGFPSKKISTLAVMDHWLMVSLSDPGHLVAVNLKNPSRPVKVIASAARKQKQSELDDAGRLLITAIIPDPKHNRFIFAAHIANDRWNTDQRNKRHGLWTWSPSGEPPKQIVHLNSSSGTTGLLSAPDPNGVVLSIQGTTTHAWFDLSASKLSLLVSQPRSDDQITDKLRKSDALARAYWHGYAPVARIGDWLWTGYKWTRLSLKTGSIEGLSPLKGSKHSARYNTAMRWMPKRELLLVGSDDTIWLLKLDSQLNP